MMLTDQINFNKQTKLMMKKQIRIKSFIDLIDQSSESAAVFPRLPRRFSLTDPQDSLKNQTSLDSVL